MHVEPIGACSVHELSVCDISICIFMGVMYSDVPIITSLCLSVFISLSIFLQLSGMGHPLACRVCGVMTYLYDSSQGARERSLVGTIADADAGPRGHWATVLLC